MPYLKASERGLEKIKQARNEKGWTVDDPQWLVEASKVLEPNVDWPIGGAFANDISEGTWRAFLYNSRKKGINTKVFKAYCKVLELEGEEIKEDSLQRHSGRSQVSDRTHLGTCGGINQALCWALRDARTPR